MRQTVVSVNGKKIDKAKYGGCKNPPFKFPVVSEVNSRRDSKPNNRKQIMAILSSFGNSASTSNGAAGNTAANTSFEEGLQSNERILAFNLNPSSSQQISGGEITASGANRTKTWLTSAATSIMYGEKKGFLNSKLLVAAHVWNGKGYVAPPSYSQGPDKQYRLHPNAEPSGLAAEVYGEFLEFTKGKVAELENKKQLADSEKAQFNQMLLQVLDELSNPDTTFSVSDLEETEAHCYQKIAECEEVVNSIDKEIEEYTNHLKNKDYFRGWCENIQVSINLPGLELAQMKSAWARLNAGAKLILKIKCVISYELAETFEIYIQGIACDIAEGYLAPLSRGKAVGTEVGNHLQALAQTHYQQLKKETAGEEGKKLLSAFINTAKEGNKKTKERNDFRAEQRRKKWEAEQQAKLLEKTRQEQIDVQTPMEQSQELVAPEITLDQMGDLFNV
jgi:hypothetical protein